MMVSAGAKPLLRLTEFGWGLPHCNGPIAMSVVSARAPPGNWLRSLVSTSSGGLGGGSGLARCYPHQSQTELPTVATTSPPVTPLAQRNYTSSWYCNFLTYGAGVSQRIVQLVAACWLAGLLTMTWTNSTRHSSMDCAACIEMLIARVNGQLEMRLCVSKRFIVVKCGDRTGRHNMGDQENETRQASGKGRPPLITSLKAWFYGHPAIGVFWFPFLWKYIMYYSCILKGL